MNWRGLVLLGLMALASVEATPRGLQGYKKHDDDAHWSDADLWDGWPEEHRYSKPCTPSPKPCTPSPVSKPCVPSPKPCKPSPKPCNPSPKPCKPSPKPCKPSPSCGTPAPTPSPVSQASPAPKPSPMPSKCAVDDWRCQNCLMAANGDDSLWKQCYDCYTSTKDDGCVNCLQGAYKTKDAMSQCIANVKGGAPMWAQQACERVSKNADVKNSCMACLKTVTKNKGPNNDFSGCHSCAEAASTGANCDKCNNCFTSGGNNWYCAKCQSSPMGVDGCYKCLADKGPYTITCVQ